MEIITLKQVKKGDYFKKVNAKGEASKRVYIKRDYDRSIKRYLVEPFDDMNDYKFLKSSALVTTDFFF